MNSNKGLTIFEVLVVLGILAIVSAFVTPNIINWRRGVQLRGAASNLKVTWRWPKPMPFEKTIM